MAKISVEFYEAQSGKYPAKDFLDGLPVKLRAKMVDTIALLRDNGPLLREPYSKPLGDGIFELRAQVGTDAARTLYFFFAGQKAILTNGFVKKTQKAPPKEIATAKKYRSDYLKREGTK